jgi:hypothetical protein
MQEVLPQVDRHQWEFFLKRHPHGFRLLSGQVQGITTLGSFGFHGGDLLGAGVGKICFIKESRTLRAIV